MSVLAGDYQPQKAAWLSSLSFHDLTRLRAVVRRVHLAYMPASMFTGHEADKLIETLGPEVADRMLKRAVDAKIV